LHKSAQLCLLSSKYRDSNIS